MRSSRRCSIDLVRIEMGKGVVMEVERDRSGEELGCVISRDYAEYRSGEVWVVASSARAQQASYVAALLGKELAEDEIWAASSSIDLRKTQLQEFRDRRGFTVVIAEDTIVQELAKDYCAQSDPANPWVLLEFSDKSDTKLRDKNEVFPAVQPEKSRKTESPSHLQSSSSLPDDLSTQASDLETMHTQERLATLNALLARCQAELRELDQTGYIYDDEQPLYILTNVQIIDSVVQLRVINRQEKRLEGLALEVTDELGTVKMAVNGIDSGMQTIRFRIKLPSDAGKQMVVVFKRVNHEISNVRVIPLDDIASKQDHRPPSAISEGHCLHEDHKEQAQSLPVASQMSVLHSLPSTSTHTPGSSSLQMTDSERDAD